MVENIIQKKIELLTTPVWSVKDIGFYFQKSVATARRIKKIIVEEKGSSPFGKQYVSRDSVLDYFGTTSEKELSSLKSFIYEDKE